MTRESFISIRVSESDLELIKEVKGQLQKKNPKIKNRSKLLRYLVEKEAASLGVQRPYVQASATD